MHSRRQLTAELLALGVSPGDVVMVHASVRAVGDIAGGPDEIHLAIKDAIGAEGTMMMYASCPRYFDEVGRGNLTADEEAQVLEKLPHFDPHTARSSQENGTLVEFLRTWPGSRVNPHVARFVVWGAQTDYLLSHQPWDYAYGRDSALDRFASLNGAILLLGCDHDNVTFLHYAEHIVDLPGMRIARFEVPVLENGVRVWRSMEEFDTSTGGGHPRWPPDIFARIVDSYLETTGNRGALVGGAQTYLLPSRGLLDFALSFMKTAAGRQPGDAP